VYSGSFGDKYGNDLESKTQAVWSTDSTKIALFIKKEKEDKMELLVFDTEKNFEQIFQSDMDSEFWTLDFN